MWWYWSHRRGFPLFIDEAGYTAVALDHVHALRHAGLHGLFDSVQNHGVHAPLVPVLTIPLEVLFGEHIGNGFLVIAAFHGVLVGATYALARRFMQPWPSALSALIVALAPEVLTFSRTYYFAVPSAALFILAVLCLLRSEALDRPAWALAGGAALGLAVLTRTLMLALVAGPLLAVFVQAMSREGSRGRRIVVLAWSSPASRSRHCGTHAISETQSRSCAERAFEMHHPGEIPMSLSLEPASSAR